MSGGRARRRRGAGRGKGNGKGERGGATGRSSGREWLKTLVVTVVLFVVLRTFVFQTFVIISGSMEDTLLVGDMLVANRLSLGARIPGTKTHLPGWAAPDRGDVMIFLPHHVVDTRLVKRVIGVPGDTLEMRDGVMWVNGARLEEPYVKNDGEPDRTDPDFAWQSAFLTSDADPATYAPTLHDWGPLVVPADRYFMMGDNRDASLDSRYWGFLEAWRMEARVSVIYFSYNRGSYKPFPALREIRWRRLFMTIGAASRAAARQAPPSPGIP